MPITSNINRNLAINPISEPQGDYRGSISSFSMNTDRIVSLMRNSKSSGAESWRTGLSSLIKGAKKLTEGQYIINDAANFDVNANIELLLTDNYPTFKTENKYNVPIEELLSQGSKNKKVSKYAKIATDVIKGISAVTNAATAGADNVTSGSFAPWTRRIPAWDPNSAKGFEFSYTFKFAMGQYGLWNAKEEVVKPILNLMAPTIPQHLNAFSISGPYPNEYNLLTNLITQNYKSSEDASSADNTESDDNENWFTKLLSNAGNALGELGRTLENLITAAYSSYTYTMKFGRFLTLNGVIIKNSRTTFSSRTDQYGWPVAGSCELDFKSIIPTALTSSNEKNLAARFGGQ